MRPACLRKWSLQTSTLDEIRNTTRRCATAIAMVALLTHAAQARELRIEHVTVVSPERAAPMPDATVIVENDRIVSIASSSRAPSGRNAEQIIDATGLFLTPGLIDSHVHTGELPGINVDQARQHADMARAVREQAPRSYLYFGYTTLIDLISVPEQRAAWNALAVHPDFYFCGGAPIADSYPMLYVPKPDRPRAYPYMIVQRGEEAKAPQGVDPATHTPEAVVSRMKADGAICVKTAYERGFGDADNWPVPRLDTIRALVQAAHAAHLPVFIHANGTDAQAFAVEAGADIIAHGLWHWNREQNATELTPRATKILDDVIKAKMGWQPTTQVLYGLRDLFDPGYFMDPMLKRVVPASALSWYRSPEGQWYHDVMAPAFLSKSELDSRDPVVQWNSARSGLAEPIARNANAIRYMAQHGARILFGTDTPSAPTYANQPGLNGWLEMQHLAAAGLTPAQIFRAATLANAEALGLSDTIGTIQPGKRANLLLLSADPTQSVQAFDRIAKVILAGRVLDRAELVAH
jgi:imidazolonepropionase-like amidohydrolase